MSRLKKVLKNNRWTLVMLAGFVVIYGVANWNRYFATDHVVLLSPDGGDFLSIERLGIEAPIVYAASTAENDIQDDLLAGVVHLKDTAMPGEVGNVYIVGHSSNYKNAPGDFNHIFAQLPEIQVGDKIEITQNISHFIYVVKDKRVVEPTELWVTSQFTEGKKILTLQTSYPVGTAKQRFIVISELKEKSELPIYPPVVE